MPQAQGGGRVPTLLLLPLLACRGSGVLELRSSRRTTWSECTASAAALPSALVCRPKPRLHLTLSELPDAPRGTAFDFTGLLLGASPRGRGALQLVHLCRPGPPAPLSRSSPPSPTSAAQLEPQPVIPRPLPSARSAVLLHFYAAAAQKRMETRSSGSSLRTTR
jgi:hypothetical protein